MSGCLSARGFVASTIVLATAACASPSTPPTPSNTAASSTATALTTTADGGWYHIRNRVSDLCLGVRRDGRLDHVGTAVDVYDCDAVAGGNIQWRVEMIDADHVMVRNRIGDLCLGVRGVDAHGAGTGVEVYHCQPGGGDPGQDNQWRRTKIGGYFHLRNRVSALCLGVRGVDGHGPNTETEVYPCQPGNGDLGRDNQWSFVPQPREEDCAMNGGTRADAKLELLTMSMHHRKSTAWLKDDYGMVDSDVQVLTKEITELIPDPTDLVITVVNANGRWDLDTLFDTCAWAPSSCLAGRLSAALNLGFTERSFGFGGQGNMSIITGPAWEILDVKKVDYPEWVRTADADVVAGQCPDDGQPRHYGVFDIRKRTPPHTRIRIYDAYLCVDGGDWTPKSKMLRHVMNVASDDRVGDVAPLITGDWNFSADPTRGLTVNDYRTIIGHPPGFNNRVEGHLALSLQPEIRNRATWIDDLDNQRCDNRPYDAAAHASRCVAENQFGDPIKNRCAAADRSCSFWTCLPWSVGQGVVHLAELNDPTRPRLRPVYHRLWKATANTAIDFATVQHKAFLTGFALDGAPSAPPPPLRTTLLATHAGMAHDCGQAEGTSWFVTGHQRGCWMIRGETGTGPFRPTSWNGLRVGFRGVAGGPVTSRFQILNEERHVASAVTAGGPMRVRALDDLRPIADGPFCASYVVSGFADRAMEFRVSLEQGRELRIDTVTITDVASDPCN